MAASFSCNHKGRWCTVYFSFLLTVTNIVTSPVTVTIIIAGHLPQLIMTTWPCFKVKRLLMLHCRYITRAIFAFYMLQKQQCVNALSPCLAKIVACPAMIFKTNQLYSHHPQPESFDRQQQLFLVRAWYTILNICILFLPLTNSNKISQRVCQPSSLMVSHWVFEMIFNTTIHTYPWRALQQAVLHLRHQKNYATGCPAPPPPEEPCNRLPCNTTTRRTMQKAALHHRHQKNHATGCPTPPPPEEQAVRPPDGSVDDYLPAEGAQN